MSLTSRAGGIVEYYIGQSEARKIEHDEADARLDFEDLLALGNLAFELIDRWDIAWHRRVHAEPAVFDPEGERAILNLYQLWLGPSDGLLDRIAQFEQLGCPVTGAESFRRHCDDARGLSSPDDEFFGEEILPAQDRAVSAHRAGDSVAFEELGD